MPLLFQRGALQFGPWKFQHGINSRYYNNDHESQAWILYHQTSEEMAQVKFFFYRQMDKQTNEHRDQWSLTNLVWFPLGLPALMPACPHSSSGPRFLSCRARSPFPPRRRCSGPMWPYCRPRHVTSPGPWPGGSLGPARTRDSPALAIPTCRSQHCVIGEHYRIIMVNTSLSLECKDYKYM